VRFLLDQELTIDIPDGLLGDRPAARVEQWLREHAVIAWPTPDGFALVSWRGVKTVVPAPAEPDPARRCLPELEKR
jgi:hypothetical protein